MYSDAHLSMGAVNSTRLGDCQNVPFYYSCNQDLVQGFSDHYLALAAPVAAYWVICLLFHYLDTSTWKWLEKYRIHESAEVTSRNRVSRSQVIWAVIFQHVLQTLLGLIVLGDDNDLVVNHSLKIDAIARVVRPVLARGILAEWTSPTIGPVSYFMYWWAIPFLQLVFGMFIIDTWQYTLHRWMHTNKWMYKHFHSWHHRLYVPYAFGALYNHPVEGFCLDSLGSVVAEILAGMTVRQATLLFVVATFKTCDDHCGYRFPWDPLQFMTSNNADYHDIHHQTVGIKHNFAQPFFIHWDVILGTRMTREEMNRRKYKKEEYSD
ncbi:sphingosine hydroxylase [Armillaria novae-zelandiae]|uniref:Sphingosine hydroxylase n=1 Tax=Armillaria novae-zelandiae TaxID=153914 RepID=A0AA39US99_9AGAR|nr:sphingosine hydroxylase [Armillaria novae-zelandiae]